MTARLKLSILLLCIFAALSPVRADIAPPVVPPRAIDSFADDKPDCLEWTDGCFLCKRQPDGAAACSTVGLACVQTEPSCAKKKAPPAQ